MTYSVLIGSGRPAFSIPSSFLEAAIARVLSQSTVLIAQKERA